MWCLWMLLVSVVVVPAYSLPPNNDGGRIKAGPLTGTQEAQYFRSAITQQNMQTILSVIEERLRGLDGVYASRVAAVQQLDTCTRRLDAIEGKIDRLENVIGLRLDKLSDAVSARSLKDQLSAEHAGRVYDNLQHRLDMASVKIQTIIESSLSRVERGQIQLATAAATGWTSAARNTVIDNATAEAIKEVIVKPIVEKISSASALLNASVCELLAHQQQNDQMSAADGQMQAEVRATVAREATNIANKMNTMYVELWRRGQALESLAKDGMAVANATRREYQDGLRAIMMQLNGRRHHHQQQQQPQQTANESSFEQAVDTLGSMVQRKMSDINRKLDSKFQEVIMAQTLFLESCHRIQLNEPQLESEVHEVLNSLLKRFMNITATTYNELQVIQELVKSRNNHVSKSVSHLSNAMRQLEQRQHDTSKTIMRLMNDMRSTFSGTGNSHIIGSGCPIKKSNDQKITGILTLLQEIQEQMTYAEIQRDEINKNNTKSIIALLSTQIADTMVNISNDRMKEMQKNEAHEKQDELFSLIGKLIDMTNRVDTLIVKLENRIGMYEKDFESQFADEDNDIDELYDSEITNITLPTELINKLRRIDAEETKIVNQIDKKEDESFDDIAGSSHGEQLFDNELDYVVDHNNNTVASHKLSEFHHESNTDYRNKRRHSHNHNHPFDRGPINHQEQRDILENDDFNIGNHTDAGYIELSDPDYDNDDIEYPIGKSDKSN